MDDEEEATGVFTDSSPQLEQPLVAEPTEAAEPQSDEQSDDFAVGDKLGCLDASSSMAVVKDEEIFGGGSYRMSESSPAVNPTFFQSQIRSRNDKDDASAVIEPSFSQLQQRLGLEQPETVESQTAQQCAAVAVRIESAIPVKLSSMDVIKEEAMTMEGRSFQMGESSQTASINEETFQEPYALAIKDEFTREGGGSCQIAESSLAGSTSGERIQEPDVSVVKDEFGGENEATEAGELPVDEDNELLRENGAHIVEENAGESDIRMGEESLVVAENQMESWGQVEAEALQKNEVGDENVEVEEKNITLERLGETIGEGDILVEVRSDKLIGDKLMGEEEASELYESSLMNVEYGESGAGHEAGRVMMHDDEAKGDEVPSQVNVTDLQVAGSPLVGEDNDMAGGEHAQEVVDLQLNRKEMASEEESQGTVDAPLNGENIAREGQSQDLVDAQLNNNEMAGDEVSQETVFVQLNDKEIDGVEQYHEMADVQLNGEESWPVDAQLNNNEMAGDEVSQETVFVQLNDKEIDGVEQYQEMADVQLNGEESWPVVTKSDELVGEDDTGLEMVMEGEGGPEIIKSDSGGKRKRGRNSKVPVKPSRMLSGEDVCFICLDGGDLVLCDRRGCPKAYHPSCVDRDESFFHAKGRWNCGWHLCSICEKNAYYMCITCTFSLCKGCVKDAVIFCVRGNKGLCETCIKTVMLIENNERGNDNEMVVFDDKGHWEFLFKDYWFEQKERLSLTSEEVAKATNLWKQNYDDNQEKPAEILEVDSEKGNGSDSSFRNVGGISSKRKKSKKRVKSSAKEVDYDTDNSAGKPEVSNAKRKAERQKPLSKEVISDLENSPGNHDSTITRRSKAKYLFKTLANEGGLASQTAATEEGVSTQGRNEWASKELLEFVMHMKNGDKSVLSQFDVQELLLEYIKRKKLRDPRRRSQIVCDSMLEQLFGKPRVGHFEMLKLLESHFHAREDSQADDNQGSVVDTEVSQMDVDENTDSLMDAGRVRGRKTRKKGDERGFQSNLDDYAAIDMHNINLVYLRRNLMETLTEDTERFRDKVVGSFVRIRISGNSQKQDIYRLVQVVGAGKAAEAYKIGKRTTDIMLEILNLDKTELVSVDTISNQEFTEDECKRLRQSIKCGLISRLTVGEILEKAKELHEVRVTDWLETEMERLRHLCDRASDLECVEKLQLLKTPEERRRRLDEIPEVHADPNMDPNYDSEDESETDDRKQESTMRQRETGSFIRAGSRFSSQKGVTLNDSWSATAKLPNRRWELSRSLSGSGFSTRREDASLAGEIFNRNSWNQVIDKSTTQLNNLEKPTISSDLIPSEQTEYPRVKAKAFSAAASETSQPLSTVSTQADAKINEAEKLWHYRDPSGKVQGPFSMMQLRKWSNTGFFPADLRIWRTTQSVDDSVLLTDALAGRVVQKEPSLVAAVASDTQRVQAPQLLPASTEKPNSTPLQPGSIPVASSSDVHGSSNLHSLTPTQSATGSTRKSRWSPMETHQLTGSNMAHPQANHFARPSNPLPSEPNHADVRPHLSQQPTNEAGVPGNKEENKQSSAGQIESASARVQATNQPLDPGQVVQAVSNMAQAGAQNNPAYGWGSGYMARSETMNPSQIPENSQGWGSAGWSNNLNSTPAPQPPYGYWVNGLVNNVPQSYGQFSGPGNFTAPNFAAMPSPSPWRPVVSPTSTNLPWGLSAPENQGLVVSSSDTAWGPVQTPWGGTSQGSAVMLPSGTPTSAASAAAFAPPTGAAAGPPLLPGNTNINWPATGTASPGWVAPIVNQGVWGQNHHQNKQGPFGGAVGPTTTPKGRLVCRFHENGHCKKGASCDYMHT
ncbi:hypothetical protein Nepgr_025438 [Nepenthes gracilis]|uniref:Zinc finger CCCH domain-containing protein 19-like n=1 Tax=Nepenthes gracilis TaxID=150966 RepID=A0AAD3Y122_NEPGR|nr:hypothetical protein Nepgr_025438 [Nepenthes gracilis]